MQVCLATLVWPLLLGASPTQPSAIQTTPPKSVAGRTLAEWTADLDNPNEFVRLRAAKSLRPFGKAAIPSLVKALGDKHFGVQYWAANHLGDVSSPLSQLQQDRQRKHDAIIRKHYEALQKKKKNGRKGTRGWSTDSAAKKSLASYKKAWEQYQADLVKAGLTETQVPSGITRLQEMEASEHPALSMVAAYALCRIDNPKDHIKLLIERLEYPERSMACHAADLLGRLGPAAKAAVPALEEAYRKNDKKPGEKGKAGADYHIRGCSQNALRLILGEWKPKPKK